MNLLRRAIKTFSGGRRAGLLAAVLLPLLLAAARPAAAETRIKTVEFNFGSNFSTDTVSGNIVKFPSRTVTIPENSVAIKSAWVEYEGISSATAITAFLIYFDSGTTTSTVRFNGGSYTAVAGGKNIRLAARADVTSSIAGQAASLASGVTFTGRVKITGPVTNMHTMKLYVTYTYDDMSPTQIKTVRYPLYINYSNLIAAATQQLAAGATVTMQYNAQIADSGASVKQQWFELTGFRQSSATTTDGSIGMYIVGNSSEPVMNLDGSLTSSYDFRYLSSSTITSGFAVNTQQRVNIVNGRSPINMLSGEVVVTYTFSPGSGSHTKTIRYFMGQDTLTGNTTSFTQPITIGEEGVTLREMYGRMVGTSSSTISSLLGVTSSVGGVAQAQVNYPIYAQATQVTGYRYVHSLTGIMGNWTNGAPVVSTISAVAGGGGQGMELVITYDYTNDASHTASYMLLAGSQTATATTLYSSTFTYVFSEVTGSETVCSAYLTGNMMSNAATANFTTTMSLSKNKSATVTNRTAAVNTLVYGYYADNSSADSTVVVDTNPATYLMSVTGTRTGQVRLTYTHTPVPEMPYSLAQYYGATQIPDGGATLGQDITFQAVAGSSMSADNLALVVEVKPNGTAFNGLNLTTGSYSAYSGTDLTLTVSSLTLNYGQYHWRLGVVGKGGRGNWVTYGGGTPDVIVRPMVINEVYPTGASAADDWIELYNITNTTYSLAGWTLVYDQGSIDSPGLEATVWTGGSTDKINAYSTFTVVPSQALSGAQSYFVSLVDTYTSTADMVQWPAMSSGQSFARIMDGNTSFFEIDPTPTKGYSNYAGTGTIKINEIAYGALGGQFIELYNSSVVSTMTLGGYVLRNKNAVAFRFTRKIYPQNYTVIDNSSQSDDGYSYSTAFGATGLDADGDFLALESSTGTTLDAVTWEGGTYSRYNYKAALVSRQDFAPANAAYSIGRSTGGVDTNDNSNDFAAMPFTTIASSNTKAGLAKANTLAYPANGQFLSRDFPLTLTMGASASSGTANNFVFQWTGGAADQNSPHIYRLQDIGFALATLTSQTTTQLGLAFNDQDGSPLVSSATYRVTLNTQNGATTAPQIVLATVTYDGSMHTVTVSTAAPARMNNATRAAMMRLDVSNNSPAGFNSIEIGTVTFKLETSTLGVVNQAQARAIFNGLMLVKESASGVAGEYEPSIDISTVSYIPMASISVDAANGRSTMTVSASFISTAVVPAASTQTFYIVFESTQNASAKALNVFRVGFNPGTDIIIGDGPSNVVQDLPAGSQIDTSSVTLIAQSSAPAGTAWPYVNPSSSPVQAMVGYYDFYTGDGTSVSSTVYIAANDGLLRAVYSTGTVKWTYTPASLYPINTSPLVTVESNSVYIYFANTNGDVYKVKDNGGSAALSWSQPFGAAIKSNILCSDGGACSSGKIYFGVSDNTVRCLNMTDGSACSGWSLAGGITGAVSSALSLDNRGTVNTGWAGLDDGKVVSINITDGSVSTSFTTGGAVVTAPLLDAYPGTNSNNLYVTSTDGTLYSRTAANLTVTPSGWTDFVTGSSIYSSPFMTYNTSGSKYIFFGADNGKLYKLDSVSGALQWSFQAGGAIRSSPVWIAGNCGTISLASDYVYFGSDDGYIYGLDAATGALRSGFPVATGGAVRADMIADCDRRTLTVGSNDGKTYTLNIGQ